MKLLINDGQKALTPDKANKIRNSKFNKNQIKKIKTSINLNQNLMFSKRFNVKNEISLNKNKEKNNNYVYNNYSINHNIYKNKNNISRSRIK